MSAVLMATLVRAFGMGDERLDWHLWNWSRWMSGRGNRLGYPKRASGRFADSSSDFDSMVELADSRCARATDAVIDALPLAQRLAVHHKHLAAVFRLRADLEASYADACERIKRELTKRGIE